MYKFLSHLFSKVCNDYFVYDHFTKHGRINCMYGKDEDCESGFMLIDGRRRLLDDKKGNWNTGKFLQKKVVIILECENTLVIIHVKWSRFNVSMDDKKSKIDSI